MDLISFAAGNSKCLRGALPIPPNEQALRGFGFCPPFDVLQDVEQEFGGAPIRF
jgi:hypothetical protein